MRIIQIVKKPIVKAAVFFTVALMMSLFLPFNTIESEAAKKITEADIQAVRDEIKANDEKIKDYQSNIDALGKDIEKAFEAKTILDQQINSIMTNIDNTSALISKYEILIKDKEMAISDKELKIEERYNDFLERLRISYEEGSQNYLELLISSENLFDFITRVDNLGSVLTYEQNLMSELEKEVASLEELKQSLTQKKSEYVELGNYQNVSQEELEKKLKESEALIAKLQKDETAEKKAFDQAQKLEDELDKELKDILKKYEDQQIQASKQAFLWPVEPRFNKITSRFGWRYIFGENNFHKGFDVAANYKTDIYAANDGVVLTAKYSSSYGYYVLIDHGGGRSTLYAHASKLLVKVGDKVNRGDVIALIGSTGKSTGYHLHFELRINGEKVDPLKEGNFVIERNGKMVDPITNNILKYYD